MQTPRSSTLRLCAVAATTAAIALAASCSGTDAESSGSSTTSTVLDAAAVDVVLSATDDVVAELDPRYQSYNVEMVEVTGGYFWAPYEAEGARVYRPPIDLTSERLRNLARELGPVYIRVSGTWANSTYFDADGTTGGEPPLDTKGS